MITKEMRRIIEDNTIGLIATVDPDGSPAVSPKGTMLVIDAATIVAIRARRPVIAGRRWGCTLLESKIT